MEREREREREKEREREREREREKLTQLTISFSIWPPFAVKFSNLRT